MARPSKYTGLESPIVRKLTRALGEGSNIQEACSYAEISKDTYYRWLKENKEFSDEIEALKTFLRMASKQVIAEALIDGDARVAMWYLDRKESIEAEKESCSCEIN